MTIYSDALLINVATVRRPAWIVRYAVFVVIVVMVQMISSTDRSFRTTKEETAQ